VALRRVRPGGEAETDDTTSVNLQNMSDHPAAAVVNGHRYGHQDNSHSKGGSSLIIFGGSKSTQLL